MTSGATPISLPMLHRVSRRVVHALYVLYCTVGYSRLPVLDYCIRRVDDGTIHIEEETVKGELLRRQGIVRCRSHDVYVLVRV
jgi:hypothetical protein